jgi:hypothetical protein
MQPLLNKPGLEAMREGQRLADFICALSGTQRGDLKLGWRALPLNPSLIAALLACRLRRRRPLLIEAFMLALAQSKVPAVKDISDEAAAPVHLGCPC